MPRLGDCTQCPFCPLAANMSSDKLREQRRPVCECAKAPKARELGAKARRARVPEQLVGTLMDSVDSGVDSVGRRVDSVDSVDSGRRLGGISR